MWDSGLTCVSVSENKELPAIFDLHSELFQDFIPSGPGHLTSSIGWIQDSDLPEGIGGFNVGVQRHGQQGSSGLRQSSSSAMSSDLKYQLVWLS